MTRLVVVGIIGIDDVRFDAINGDVQRSDGRIGRIYQADTQRAGVGAAGAAATATGQQDERRQHGRRYDGETQTTRQT